MAIVKRVSSPYTIQTINSTDGITLNSSLVTVTGNLVVLGNTSQIESNATSITDNFVTLNAGETGPGVSLLGTTSGIIVDRGTRANVKLQWQEGANVWQVSDVTGSVFANIYGGGLAGDPSPTLHANLNTQSYQIFSNVGNINFNGNLQLVNQTSLPAYSLGNTIIYAANVGGGTSGIYVVSSGAANQELVTKARAFGFSLLL